MNKLATAPVLMFAAMLAAWPSYGSPKLVKTPLISRAWKPLALVSGVNRIHIGKRQTVTLTVGLWMAGDSSASYLYGVYEWPKAAKSAMLPAGTGFQLRREGSSPLGTANLGQTVGVAWCKGHYEDIFQVMTNPNQAGTLLINGKTTRGINGGTNCRPEHIIFKIYKLKWNIDAVPGFPFAEFTLLRTITTKKTFCGTAAGFKSIFRETPIDPSSGQPMTVAPPPSTRGC